VRRERRARRAPLLRVEGGRRSDRGSDGRPLRASGSLLNASKKVAHPDVAVIDMMAGPSLVPHSGSSTCSRFEPENRTSLLIMTTERRPRVTGEQP